MLENDCSKDYFMYVARGDLKGNCDCKTKTTDEFTSPKDSWFADVDVYKTQIGADLIEIRTGVGNGENGECAFGLEWDDKGKDWRASFYALTKDYPNTKKISFANTNGGWPRVIQGGLKGLTASDYPNNRKEIYVYESWVPGTKEFSVGRYHAWGPDTSVVSQGTKENHAKSYWNANHDAFSFFAYSDNDEAVAP